MEGNTKGDTSIEGDLILARGVRRFACLYDTDKLGQAYRSRKGSVRVPA